MSRLQRLCYSLFSPFYTMNKFHVIEHLRFALEAQLESAKQAAQAAHDAATHEQSIAETQYDSLGIEAAYLAQGQAERVDECYKTIQAFEAVFKETTVFAKIRIGALVCLEDEQQQQQWFYLGPRAGGLNVAVHGVTVKVITPEAPLGKQLLGKYSDDEIELVVAEHKRFYTVDKVL